MKKKCPVLRNRRRKSHLNIVGSVHAQPVQAGLEILDPVGLRGVLYRQELSEEIIAIRQTVLKIAKGKTQQAQPILTMLTFLHKRANFFVGPPQG